MIKDCNSKQERLPVRSETPKYRNTRADANEGKKAKVGVVDVKPPHQDIRGVRGSLNFSDAGGSHLTPKSHDHVIRD